MKTIKTFIFLLLNIAAFGQAVEYDTLSTSNGISPLVENDWVKYPIFKGGEAKLHEYITSGTNKYLKQTGKQINDKVYLSFIVTKTGTIESVKVRRAARIDKSLDEVAFNIIKNMPNWEPGLNKDYKPFDVLFSLMVPFKSTK